MALSWLLVALVGVHTIGVFAGAFQDYARSAWTAQLSLQQGVSALPGLLSTLLWLLLLPLLASLACMVVQRAPTLQASTQRAPREHRRGRPPLGRATRASLQAVKVLVLGASFWGLLHDSVAGWRATAGASAAELLAIVARAVPALLVRAAWIGALLAVLELTVQYLARMRRLRMTRQQRQDEHRELVGDPRLSSERRARGRGAEVPVRSSPQLLASDIAQLSAAALLVTGGACVVAVEYAPELGVPRVWVRASGNDALELLRHAYSLDLPIVSDDLLAQGLFHAPLKAAIPNAWHARVAQLLVEHGIPRAREVV